MDGGADVRVGVELIKSGDKPGEEIIPCKFRGPQLLGSGIYEINNHCDRVGYYNEIHELFEGFHVKKQSVDMYAHEIDEPEKIGKQEKLAKGYQVVQRGIHNVKIACNAATLHQGEENSENRPEKQKPKVAELHGIYVAQAKAAVINDFTLCSFMHIHFLSLPYSVFFGKGI